MPEKRRITRSDIKTFDKAATSLILEMGEAGWTGHLTSDGMHVRMYSPDGALQYTVSRTTYRKESMANGRLDFERWRDAQPKQEKPVETERWPCPRPDCNKTFVSLEKLSVHTNVDHEGLLKCPDCDYYHRKQSALNLHRANSHGYVSPTKHLRDARKLTPVQQALVDFDENRAAAFSVQVMDKAEILAIETPAPMTAEALKLKPVPAAPPTPKPAALEQDKSSIATHWAIKDDERMRVRLSPQRVYIKSGLKGYNNSAGAISNWKQDGWTFEEIKPDVKEFIRSLRKGTIFVVFFPEAKAEVWAKTAREDVKCLGTDDVYEELSITMVDWSSVKSIHLLSEKVW
ncbi:DNA binding protein [Microbacterium phage Burro]|uniref:DNA binding protein n=1 Tax=Microbacterium phage Burro TaxID=2315703 RepID=A0A386KLD1_9CAUD|nr:DNA binding protein [Microbacterium phage Burro]AYD86166.1 DNA binding protein [Microbacterium phage Burro]